MDKIYEKLANVLSAEDLNEVKSTFEAKVSEKVKAKLEEETKNLTKKADDFCQKKIKEAVEAKTAELEKLANKYCEERCAKITEDSKAEIKAMQAKLEEAAQAYIKQYFEEKFTEKYGEELSLMESKMIKTVNDWLDYQIKNKISNDLIKNTAKLESFEPIINTIKEAFEVNFVALDTTGSKKYREAKAEVATLQTSLKKQISENMRLVEVAENAKKTALIGEKTIGLTRKEKEKVANFFESKSFSATKHDIDDYVEMIMENDNNMRETRKQLFERHSKPVSRSAKVEDATADIITEKYKSNKLSSDDEFLLKSSSYIDED